MERELAILHSLGSDCLFHVLLPLTNVPFPHHTIILYSDCEMQIAEEMSVGHLEELMTDKHHGSLNVFGDFKVLCVPLIEVEVTLVYFFHFFEEKVIIVVWLWWIKLTPKFDVLEVQIVVGKQRYEWYDYMPYVSRLSHPNGKYQL